MFFKAFALTDSKIHNLTEDRGKTWRSFEVPVLTSRRQAAVVPFRFQEMGIRVQHAIVKGRTPFATTRYMSFPPSLTHILT